MDHRYEIELDWLGDLGEGTVGYRAYARDFECRAGAKPALPGSADPHFRGDPARWSPEDLLVASLAACHQLWYLHLCADAGVVVRAYRDRAEGTMVETADGAGEFTSVTLRPRVELAPGSDPDRARALHAEAAGKCFIARSVAFPVHHEPEVSVGAAAAKDRAPSPPDPSARVGTARATECVSNGRVRVTRWDFPERGDNTGWHRHEHDYVVVPLTDGTLEIVDAAGARTAARLLAGVPYYRDAGVEHDVVNGTDGAFAFVETEILVPDARSRPLD